jgi:hypothetical protein
MRIISDAMEVNDEQGITGGGGSSDGGNAPVRRLSYEQQRRF